VLLKRGLSATLDEWLLAAEYVMAEGNYQIVLCERGIRTFAQHTRNTMDLAAIPAVRRISHLPVIVDPSHVLNAFAYTGGMSLAAAAAGASVVHLDAAEGIVAWARDNAQLSGLAAARIRWVVEDVTKFLTREVRRGNKYDAMVLDPPSFGRGSKGEVWKLERDLPALLDLCRQVLSDEPLCVLLSAHTPGVTPLVLARLLADMLGNHRGLLTSMEMVIPHSDGTQALPSGALARWSRD